MAGYVPDVTGGFVVIEIAVALALAGGVATALGLARGRRWLVALGVVLMLPAITLIVALAVALGPELVCQDAATPSAAAPTP